jgi:hypothetical protein
MAYGVDKARELVDVLKHLSIPEADGMSEPESIRVTLDEINASTNPFFLGISKANKISSKSGMVFVELPPESRPQACFEFLKDAVLRPQVKINGMYFIDLLRDYYVNMPVDIKKTLKPITCDEDLITSDEEHIIACLSKYLGRDYAHIILNSFTQQLFGITSEYLMHHVILTEMEPVEFNAFPCQFILLSIDYYLEEGKLMATSTSHIIGFMNTVMHRSDVIDEPYPLYGKVTAKIQYESAIKAFTILGYNIIGPHKEYIKVAMLNAESAKLADLWQLSKPKVAMEDEFKKIRLEAVQFYALELLRTHALQKLTSYQAIAWLCRLIKEFYLLYDRQASEFKLVMDAYQTLSLRKFIQSRYASVSADEGAKRDEGKAIFHEIIGHYLDQQMQSLCYMLQKGSPADFMQELQYRLDLLLELKLLADSEAGMPLVRVCQYYYSLKNPHNRFIIEYVNLGMLACSYVENNNAIKLTPRENSSKLFIWLKDLSVIPKEFHFTYHWYGFLNMASTILREQTHAVLDLFYNVVKKLAPYPRELFLVSGRGFVLGLMLSIWRFNVTELMTWPDYSYFHAYVSDRLRDYLLFIIAHLKDKRLEYVKAIHVIIQEQLNQRSFKALAEAFVTDPLIPKMDSNLLFDPHLLAWLEVVFLKCNVASYSKYIAEISLSRRDEFQAFGKGLFGRGDKPLDFGASLEVINDKIKSQRLKSSAVKTVVFADLALESKSPRGHEPAMKFD